MLKTIAIIIFVSILAGCTDFVEPLYPAFYDPTQVQPTQQEEPTPPAIGPVSDRLPPPRPGGALRLSMRAPKTLNPLLNEDITVARVLQLMYEPLITFDEQMRPVPHLASLEFAFHGASVLVTIRENARWSDGSLITSDDLIYSITTLQNAPPDAIYRKNVENFASFETVNERTVRIFFETISGGSAYLFNFPIIPRLSDASSGPFMLESHTPIETLTLTRNRYTFRDRPYISEVNVLITSDALTDLHAFDRGLVDIFLADVPQWSRHHSVKPVQVAEYHAMYFEFIGFNFARELQQKRDFRQAIALSLNVETLISDIFLTHAIPTSSPIHPSSWLHEPDALAYNYCIESARNLSTPLIRHLEVDEEGEKIPLTVLVNEGNIEGVRIARVLVNQMNYIGLKAELVALPFEEYSAHLINGEFDLFVGGYNLSLQPDLRFAFHSESPYNLLSYRDPELDRLLEAAAVSGTDSQFHRTLSDIQLHIATELPVISLAFRHSAVIMDRRISGDLRPIPDNVFANVEDWFIVN